MKREAHFGLLKTGSFFLLMNSGITGKPPPNQHFLLMLFVASFLPLPYFLIWLYALSGYRSSLMALSWVEFK
jgi:hypothetical protein